MRQRRGGDIENKEEKRDGEMVQETEERGR